MLGMLFGAITIGDISDRFGRKVGLVASIVILSVCGIFSSISPNIYIFLILRFLTGAGGVGLFQVVFIIGNYIIFQEIALEI